MARVVVGTFPTRAEGERAAEELMGAGFTRDEIEIRSQDTHTERADDSGGGWWEWLFGESDDRSYYNEALERGGAILSVNTTDDRADRARAILEAWTEDEDLSRAAEMESRTTGIETSPATTRVRGDEASRSGEEEEVIPVVEEQLRVGKRPVTRGGARVYSRVTERPVEEEVRLREEHVRIERRPADRPVTAADEAFRDRYVELTETAEEVVVAKEARVVEEVVVGREVDERVETVRDSVRRTDVDVQGVTDDADDFRRHWITNFQASGVPYETYEPAYGYGRQLRSDARYEGREWTAVEADARRDWEQRSPGTWERFKDAIRYSWDNARGGRRRAA